MTYPLSELAALLSLGAGLVIMGFAVVVLIVAIARCCEP